MAKTPVIGIIGLGYWGPNLLRNFASLDECRVKYGCDRSNERIKKLQKIYPNITFTTSAEELFNDPEVDGIVIATPTSAHFELAKKALDSGKHVLVEKPMTSDSKKAQTLVGLAKKKKKNLLVDHTFAYTSAVLKINDLIKKNALGKLLYFDSVRINLGIIQKDTNVIWDLAVHDLAILNSFVDFNDITEIFAHGSAHYGKHIEIGHLHLKFSTGFYAHIHVSWLSPVKVRHTILGGSKAMILFDDTEPSEKIRLYDRGIDHDDTKPDPFFPKYRSGDVLIPALDSTEALFREAEHFIACIKGKEKPIVSGEHGRQMVHILEVADQSLKMNKPLKVTNL